MSFNALRESSTGTVCEGRSVHRSGRTAATSGETAKTVTIEVNGESKREADETRELELFGNVNGSLFTKKSGVGAIVNGD